MQTYKNLYVCIGQSKNYKSLNTAIYNFIDRGIQRFVVDQLKIFKMGLGWFNEQGGESAHKLIKEMAGRVGSLNNPDNIKSALEKFTLNYLT